ncbi:class I SAM-dependent methyltransferase [Spirochaeta cellobiosiphila]|uniref:methyltransferase domain-containing protein n=1 Tax=Spirochaeta cellobiosiphila TaxID=504483 RepID=UPI0004205298|nr:class I SAM-dependent methyltransferase [Spirochaeta cellobiosiphila]
MIEIDKLNDHYLPRFEKHSENYEILDWESKEAQYQRFEQLTNLVDLKDKSILDIGCGLGDLNSYLKSNGINSRYIGTDVLAKMIDECKRSFQDGVFFHCDLFSHTGELPVDLKKSLPVDLIYISGIFNLNIGDMSSFFIHCMDSLDSLFTESLVFNLLSVDSPAKEEKYSYFDPQWVKEQLKSYPWDVQLFNQYRLNDFTILCQK